MTKKIPIGIDLGTTYSCVGVFQNDRVEIIANDQGQRTTPSYVAFNDSERLIGDSAKNQSSMNPENTVFDAKRLIGRKFSDASVQSDLKHFPFKVVAGRDDKPLIEVNFKLRMSAGSSMGEDSRHRLSLLNKEAFVGTYFQHVWNNTIYELPKLVLDRFIFDIKIDNG